MQVQPVGVGFQVQVPGTFRVAGTLAANPGPGWRCAARTRSCGAETLVGRAAGPAVTGCGLGAGCGLGCGVGGAVGSASPTAADSGSEVSAAADSGTEDSGTADSETVDATGAPS